MNNKGFTLVELLAVIVILGILVAISVPAIGKIANNINDNMLDKKITFIEEAAVSMGEHIQGSIKASTLRYNGNPCRRFIVSDLVPTYLAKDVETNNCLTSTAISTVGCVVDPSDTTHYLDKLEVIIFYKNKRIYAVVDVDDNKTCR